MDIVILILVARLLDREELERRVLRGVFKSAARNGSVVFLILMAALFATGEARANGGTPRLARAPAGPYLVSIWTQPDPPRVGRLDVSVAVMRPTTGEPVLDIRGQVGAESLGGKERVGGVKLERGAGGNLLLYHGELEVPVVGQWRVIVTLDGADGSGEAMFALEVRPPPRLPRWALLMGAITLGMLVWLWASRSRAPRA